MRFVAIVLTAAVLAATPAFAQTAPVESSTPTVEESAAPPADATAPGVEVASVDPDEEIICRTVRRTESRLRNRRERICGTRAEWEMMQDQIAREVNRIGSIAAPSNQ